MSILSLIRGKIQNSEQTEDERRDNHDPALKKGRANNEPEELLTAYLDGMGTATARILVDKHLSNELVEKHGLQELKNRGRYYTAKIIDPTGKVIDQVLIDKQSGVIQSLHRKVDHRD